MYTWSYEGCYFLPCAFNYYFKFLIHYQFNSITAQVLKSTQFIPSVELYCNFMINIASILKDNTSKWVSLHFLYITMILSFLEKWWNGMITFKGNEYFIYEKFLHYPCNKFQLTILNPLDTLEALEWFQYGNMMFTLVATIFWYA